MELRIEQLLQSPRLKLFYDEAGETLRREAAKRRRFRESLREDAREEFINGEVVVQVPARERHIVAVKNFTKLLDTHVVMRKLGAVHSEQSLTSFSRNDYCPDVCFWKKVKSKGFTPEQIVFPIPDFICEVLSASTVETDRGVKFDDYAGHGVAEYWMMDPAIRSIEQYLLREGRYDFIGRFTKGVIRGRVVKGFKIPVLAAFDPEECLAWLRQLLRS